jgi:hypothetical protein
MGRPGPQVGKPLLDRALSLRVRVRYLNLNQIQISFLISFLPDLDLQLAGFDTCRVDSIIQSWI